MKSFKQYLNEMNHNTLGTPVLITHGMHSIPKHLREWTANNPATFSRKAVEEYYSKEVLNPHLHDGSDPGFYQTEDHLHRYYDKNKLPIPLAKAVMQYTSTSYDLNTHLFETHRQGLPPNKQLYNIDDTDAAMHHTPIPEKLGHLDVFSGVKFNVEKAAERGGGKLFLPAYTSTSLDPGVADHFTKKFFPGTENPASAFDNTSVESHILRIRVPAGHPGFFVGRQSQHMTERELILPRGTQLVVHPKPLVLHHRNYSSSNSTPSTVKVWHADANYIGPQNERKR